MNLTEEEITYPDDEPNPDLIAICTTSTERGIELREILLSGSFAVIGIFKDIASLLNALNTYEIVAAVYDTRDNYENTFSFLTAIKRFPRLPVLLVGPLDHTINRKLARVPNKFSEIKFPFNRSDVLGKVQNLIGGKMSGMRRPATLISYVNKVLSDMIAIAPREIKGTVKEIITYNVDQLIQHTNALDKEIETASYLTLCKNVEAEALFEPLNSFFVELVEQLESKVGEELGGSLLRDSLYQAFFAFRKSPKLIEKFLIYCGYTDLEFTEQLSKFIPEDNFELKVKSAFFVLEDMGPTMHLVTKKDLWPTLFNEMTASQYISLVGQGENYHEGLYGPFPSGADPDVMVLIYSRQLEDETIEDDRLKGHTLSVVALAFPKSLIQSLPPRYILLKVFQPLMEINAKKDVAQADLQQIETNFLALFKR